MERFETQYPITAREKEIKQILEFVTRGESVQLISVPGAGRSTVLRLLAYNPKLREYHLKQFSNEAIKQSGNYLFVYINFAELPSFEALELTKFLFLGITAAIRETNDKKLIDTGKEIYAIFKEALALNDPLVMTQMLKRAIVQLNNPSTGSGQVVPVFLFDRFSEFLDKIPKEFLSGLKSLGVPIVFSTHKPIESLLPDFLIENKVFLSMLDPVATDFRIEAIEKEYKKKLDKKTKDEIVRLTGGHGRLVKLATQAILSNHPKKDIVDFLLSNSLIKDALGEIDEASFPLFLEFKKRGMTQEVVKSIRFDKDKNEIFFGDTALSDLTAHEFNLLSFLINNPDRVVERDEVISSVWTESQTQGGVTDQALDQMVYRLRRKIEDEADNPKHLLTVKGRGFKFLP